jgi:hypothetical protein
MLSRRSSARDAPLGIYALGWLVAMLLASSAAHALEHFDFEGPYLVDPGHSVKDHAIYMDGSVFHCYYIRGVDGQGSASERELGHAISTDLCNWTILPPALTAGPQTWDSRNVWAPAIVQSPPGHAGQFVMLYTGADPLVVQRTGQATSTSAYGPWSKAAVNPWLQPDSLTYLWSPSTSFSAFRDPFYFYANGLHHLLHTVLLPVPGSPPSRRGAVHHLTSPDFVNWTDAGPLLVHNGPSNVSWHEIESVQLYQAVGFWHFFFSETDELGERYLRSSQLNSGWDMNSVMNFDLGTAAELTFLPGTGRYLFTRHVGTNHLSDGSLFFVLAIDSLRFDPGLGLPIKVPSNVLAKDWPQISGTAFLAAPTFGDNSLERGDVPTNPTGHGYISSREFYQGPLSGRGSPGAELGGVATGLMKSRVFILTGTHIELRVGGGADPNCSVALMDAHADTALFRARDSGSPALQTVRWETWAFRGRSAYLTIVDNSTLPEGYINVDDIREIYDPTDVPPAERSRAGAQLLPNIPNPFNPMTTLHLRLSQAGRVELRIHDARGRLLLRLPQQWLQAGEHAVPWDGRDATGKAVASGVYRVVLRVGGQDEDAQAVTLVR